MIAAPMFRFEQMVGFVRRFVFCRHAWLYAERQPELCGIGTVKAKCAKCDREAYLYGSKIIG